VTIGDKEELVLMATEIKRGETKFFGVPDGGRVEDMLYIPAATIVSITAI
jgi:hypothetical protein